MSRKIHNESLGYHFELTDRPRRIVSLVSSATEAIDKMGLIDALVGVSAYCHRYVPDLKAPVCGEYLSCDMDRIRALEPDLILTTGGVQLKLATMLARDGFPVYALPLPRSFYGILDNIHILGALMNELKKARELASAMQKRADQLRRRALATRPKIYLELWLGRHMRATGGASFINDLVEIAGGDLIFQDHTEGYFTPDFDTVCTMEPDVYLFFHEPEHLIDPAQLVQQRNWNPDTRIIVSTVKCGENMIQDGPSLLDTAEWLQRQLTSP